MSEQPPTPIPDLLRRQFEQIAARAAAHGRALHPMPTLELAARDGQGSRAIPGPARGRQRPRVRLGRDLLDVAPDDRAWTIAHELSHILRAQQSTRPRHLRGPLGLAELLLIVTVAAMLAAGGTLLRGSGPDLGWLLTLATLSAAGGLLAVIALGRREESATDVTAATVFSEVLTPAGVQRLRRAEGALSGYVPNLLRTHPRPAARRRAGLACRPDLGG